MLALALVAIAPARAGESTGYEQPGYWKCQTIQANPTAPLYVSDIFELQADPAEVQNGFQQSLAAKYGVKGQVSCSMAYKGAGILEKLKADDQRWFEQIRSGGGEVVETHWSFQPASARLPYLCMAGAQYQKDGARAYSYFYTDAFDMPGSEQPKLTRAWTAYVEALHPDWFFPAKGCILLPADPASRQAVIDGQAAPWKAQNAEIVHASWKYAPESADASPSAAAASAAYATNQATAQHFYQCFWTAVGRGYYITDGFGSDKDPGAAWRAYMLAKHPPSEGFAQMRCMTLPDDAGEREKMLRQNAAIAGQGATRIDWRGTP
jgi:hypothetical protein